MIRKLIDIWLYSDSEPTEITLGLCCILFIPLCSFSELGCMPAFKICVGICGVYQLWAVAKGEIDGRVTASALVFAMAITTMVIYLVIVGWQDPMHYKWIVLVLCAFGSLTRLLREKHYKNG